MSDDHDLLIRIHENVESIKQWVDQHDCTHKELRGDIDLLKQWKWRWAGAIGILTILLTFVGNVAARIIVR